METGEPTVQADITRYTAALNERFGIGLDPAENPVRIEIEGGPAVHVAFSDDRVTTRIGIPAAHDGLPEAILRELLRMTFPSGLLAGATLAVKPNQDFLEMVDVAPLAAVQPATFATTVAAQAAGAIEVARRIADLSFAALNPTTAEVQ